MSDNPNEPTQWQDQLEVEDPTLDEPTADDLDDPELNAAEADALDVDSDLDASSAPPVEPGAEGPEGTGIEGADNELLDAKDMESGNAAPDIPDEFSTDSSPAAEQGNRRSDHMVSEDHDDAEVAELSGDDLDVDALADDGIEQRGL
ncbi:hypothetical protein [Brevibacterium sp. RIT 803]|uniref:hypothetical protein n=1 Tax=Brevibacterium sp. RIT 803 TaxID=2810210 RepID=UPI00194FBD4A|nr:hypothetical protein [Brevibacterium sp. RIT 803]MBM6591374.1 hypothetical protein [Brevibacterium sp. RIT 803]